MRENPGYTKTPSDLELLEYFESEPVESVPYDGFWSYECTDGDGVTVRLSCNAIAQSIQTDVVVGGRQVVTVVHECAEEIKIENDVLFCSFTQGQLTQLEVRVRPNVSVKWSSLRVE